MAGRTSYAAGCRIRDALRETRPYNGLRATKLMLLVCGKEFRQTMASCREELKGRKARRLRRTVRQALVATHAENFAESASNAIGAGTNAADTPVATPADSAANPLSHAAEPATAAGSIENTTTNLLRQARTSWIVTGLRSRRLHRNRDSSGLSVSAAKTARRCTATRPAPPSRVPRRLTPSCPTG